MADDFGVSTLPAYRRNGYAEKLIRYVINDARAQDRTGIVLTCKESLIHYYEKFGFQKEGISNPFMAERHGIRCD